jgi:hypothetical protein
MLLTWIANWTQHDSMWISCKLAKLEAGMEELLALANKGRGGFWAGMMIVSAISSVSGYFIHWFQGAK